MGWFSYDRDTMDVIVYPMSPNVNFSLIICSMSPEDTWVFALIGPPLLTQRLLTDPMSLWNLIIPSYHLAGEPFIDSNRFAQEPLSTNHGSITCGFWMALDGPSAVRPASVVLVSVVRLGAFVRCIVKTLKTPPLALAGQVGECNPPLGIRHNGQTRESHRAFSIFVVQANTSLNQCADE